MEVFESQAAGLVSSCVQLLVDLRLKTFKQVLARLAFQKLELRFLNNFLDLGLVPCDCGVDLVSCGVARNCVADSYRMPVVKQPLVDYELGVAEEISAGLGPALFKQDVDQAAGRRPDDRLVEGATEQLSVAN